MDTYIHRVKQIVKDEIKENTKENGAKYYSMQITFIYDELGHCKERHSDNTVWGDAEVTFKIALFADTKEALEIKAEVLTTEEG